MSFDENGERNFYVGIVKSIVPSKTKNDFIINTIAQPMFGDDKTPREIPLILHLTVYGSDVDNRITLANGENVILRISNKKARKVFSSLLNKDGDDYLYK